MQREDLIGWWSHGELYVGGQSDWWLCFRDDGLAALSYETAHSSEAAAFTWELDQETLHTRALDDDDARRWQWGSVTFSLAAEAMPLGKLRPVLRFPVTPRGPALGPDHYAQIGQEIPSEIDGFLHGFDDRRPGS